MIVQGFGVFCFFFFVNKSVSVAVALNSVRKCVKAVKNLGPFFALSLFKEAVISI